MDRPKQITAEEYWRHFNRMQRKAFKLQKEHRSDAGPPAFFSYSITPCGVSSKETGLMAQLNPHEKRDAVNHLMEIPCEKVKDLHCPHTMVECLAQTKDGFFYHKHPVGECWFRVYPRRSFNE